MDIWLIQNGKKVGPYQDYVVREKIRDWDIGEDDHAWHEGMETWMRLDEIDLFKDEFQLRNRAKIPPPLPSVRHVLERDPVIGERSKLYLGRRFWARWLDLMVFSTIWWLAMYLAGRDIGAAVRNPWVQLSIYIPWFALEALLIRRFGTTPGKWLLGLRVSNDDGTKLELKASVWRSLRVMVTGVGFGWGILALCCQALSWMTTRWIGKPIWDHLGKHKLEASPLKAFGIVAVVVIFIATAHLKVAVVGPHQEKMIIETYPDMKKFFERGTKWYFPVKE